LIGSGSESLLARYRVSALILASGCVFFHLFLIFSGLTPNLVSRPIHMAFVLPWILCLGTHSSFTRMTGYVLAIAGIWCCLWIAFAHDSLGDQYGFLESNAQVAGALILLLVVIEAARRAVGWPLPLVAATALGYALWGEYIPGEFGHSGMPLESLLGSLIITEGGIWGILTGISVNVVAIFVIFGAVLNSGEAGRGFMNIAASAAGRLRGGGAKVSVISSALFGSISGSASANVASTGAITLPAMIRLGYPKRLAGAVEAVASSGGQIMPPLMGAGAFVMVELTQVPYTGIMAAALLPAILYFFAVWVGINAYAHKYDLKGIPQDEKPLIFDVIVTSVFFLIPFSVLLWGMFVANLTPQYSACLAIFSGTLLLLTDKEFSFEKTEMLRRIECALITSARQIALIGAIILCASIIIGVLGITGLGVKVTSLIVSLSGANIWPAVFLTALACLALGMEVPTTAAYVVCVSVAGPALIDLGLQPLQAHLFVFWFALISTITPPVCGAVFIASGMVNENWLKVALTSMALGVGLYVIPIGMIANPELIELAHRPWEAFLAFCQVGAGLGLISYGLISPSGIFKRLLLLAAGAVVIFGRLILV